MVVSNRYKSVQKERGRECSPPSTFAPGLIPRVGVTCGLSLLLVLTLAQRVLLPVLNPTFHILIQSGNSGQEEPLHGMTVAKFPLFIIIM